jgi:cytochrome c biogenesis protein CcmG/thiol:disulfide interchange protein DsbE
MRWVKVLVPLSVIPLLLLLAYGFGKDPKRVPSPLVGRESPNFTISLLEGGELTLRELRGKIVVMNFWASWCYPACWNEAPRLEAAWRRYKDQGVVLVGIVYQDTEGNARDFIAKHGKTYPNGMDVRSRIAIEYGVYGVPETFFIDREGRVAHKHIGEIDMGTLVTKIETLLPVPWAAECKEWVDLTFGKIQQKELVSSTAGVRSWLGKAGAFLREAEGLCGKDDTSARAKFNEAWVILGQLNR